LALAPFEAQIVVAAGLSATAAYASAYGRPRDASSRVNGRRLLTKTHIRERITKIESHAALSSVPTIYKVLNEAGRTAVDIEKRDTNVSSRATQAISAQPQLSSYWRHFVRLKPKKETGQHAADRLFEEFSMRTQKTQTSNTSNQGMVIESWHRTGFLPVLLDPKLP
jgi:hypothetical protein